LKELRPDVIVTQSHCEVCAVSEHDVEQAVSDWLDYHPQVISLKPNNLTDVWMGMYELADALGVPDHGPELGLRLAQRMGDITEKARGLPDRPRVACIEWVEPLMAIGNWMPELVEMAGGVNLFGEAGKHSPWMTWDELVAKDPDVIVVMPCGFDI